MKRAGVAIIISGAIISGAIVGGACGGKAVVDPVAGGGGGGGASTTTSSTTTSGIGGGGAGTTTTTTTGSGGAGGVPDPCPALEAQLDEALAAAVECNPALSIIQCSGVNVIFDKCGCEVAGNDHYPELATAAMQAYAAWEAAKCGPWLCEWCPPPPPEGPWACVPGADGTSGTCMYAAWD